jgi:ribosomal protein L37AE/L43A
MSAHCPDCQAILIKKTKEKTFYCANCHTHFAPNYRHYDEDGNLLAAINADFELKMML